MDEGKKTKVLVMAHKRQGEERGLVIITTTKFKNFKNCQISVQTYHFWFTTFKALVNITL